MTDEVHSAPGEPSAGGAMLVGTRIAIFNVKFSPNLGDGIIAECLEAALRAYNPAFEIVALDISGRQDFSSANGQSRKRILSLLEALPPTIRKFAVPIALHYLVNRRIKPHWALQLEGVRHAVIGGGALLADQDQNFPIKLAAVLELCGRNLIPVSLSHLGVSVGWSDGGHRRFARALHQANIMSFTVRDKDSQLFWHRQFEGTRDLPPGFPRPALAADPGLLASEIYGVPPSADVLRGGKQRIGICVTAPHVLRLHAQHKSSIPTMHWTCAFADALLHAGVELSLFTNGSPEDQLHLDAIAAQLGQREGLRYAPRFTRPVELAHFISGLDAVVAHRLHACIVAHSFGLPAVGLSWDPKVASFFEGIGRFDFMIDPGQNCPATVARLALKAVDCPPDPDGCQRLREECRQGIDDLASKIMAMAGVR